MEPYKIDWEVDFPSADNIELLATFKKEGKDNWYAKQIFYDVDFDLLVENNDYIKNMKLLIIKRFAQSL